MSAAPDDVVGFEEEEGGMDGRVHLRLPLWIPRHQGRRAASKHHPRRTPAVPLLTRPGEGALCAPSPGVLAQKNSPVLLGLKPFKVY